jgi:phosphoribosylformylglycinamidine synthase
MGIDKEALEDVALSEEEYHLIIRRLGREPTIVELGMFGSLWSEHCGYKHSKRLLSLLPSRGKRVLTKVGEENAGAVDIGDGLSVVMKMESHNHPSAIEPYQGAATGIGGIVRDIFAMGARPIALLDPLRFGPMSEPHNRYLFNGVVGGIAGYGNCIGIPTMGGDVFFSNLYSQNPLINVMCVGLARSENLIKARASGTGNLLMLVGADTGRDGLHGASGLASRTFEDDRELRPTVQVGNPFLEKLLMEACLQLVETDWLEGLQDLGAAGLTSATVECVAKGGSGMELDVSLVPRRQEGLTPYEVMLSESQERMLVVVKKGYQDKVSELFKHWGLRSDIIGHVTDDGMARIKENGEVVAEAPVKLLTDPPLYQPRAEKPRWLRHLQVLKLDTIPDLAHKDLASALLKLLASPNIASKRYVYRQYDHQVGDNTVIPPGGDAAVLRIKDTKKAIALTTDGNGRYCYLNPRGGGAIAVAEAGRNLVCTGAEPIALTDCLNFGNPEKSGIYYQMRECVRGMANACRVLDIPVISGNVSLYNETGGEAVYPTPVVGMVGLIEDVSKRCTTSFKRRGDLVFLLGADGEGEGLDGSEYLEAVHAMVRGKPTIDLELEKLVQRCCLLAIKQGIVKSAHDCSDGGLAIALAESCIDGDIGFGGDWKIEGRLDEALFGESQSRIVVSVDRGDVEQLESIAGECQVLLRRLGVVGGEHFVIGEHLKLPVKQMGEVWEGGLEVALGVSPPSISHR